MRAIMESAKNGPRKVKMIWQRHASVMLSAWGMFGVFRIFVTRTAKVTSLSVDIYRNPFLGEWVRFKRAQFLELQNCCNPKELYRDVQRQILQTWKSWATMKCKSSKDDYEWRGLTKIVNEFRIIVGFNRSNDKPRRWITKIGGDYKWLQNISSVR